MEKLILPAPAKLNRFLHINSQRLDGYHDLQTIFQFIDYGDTLTFIPRDDGQITVNAKIPGLSQKNNLVYRAAKLIQRHDKNRRGVEITLEKKIPMGAGLGGGSSNAATTLHGLNKLWDLKLSSEFLQREGLLLGADVPVFVQGHACWAEGLGEIMTPMQLPESWFVVVVPPVHVATAEIFFDQKLPRDTPRVERSLALLQTGWNDCQAVVGARFPEVAQAIEWLSQFGRAQMTGTGCAVFAPFANKTEATNALAKIPSSYTGFMAKGLNVSPLLTTLHATR
jgi:4-diphosphocytidyl-2-C-methyl-D-erythritol kinase